MGMGRKSLSSNGDIEKIAVNGKRKSQRFSLSASLILEIFLGL